ncbi:SUN domain-containing protein 3-like [Thalassophryne amazonica]|uniref:SUN domain-containing protein 3-like n=2 Tax=Thalassophryne amazonica TaxID=390379 RepID=UPI001470CAD9|nr:SUN domain-containing protein 3-like [Thalassophryne amazonica]
MSGVILDVDMSCQSVFMACRSARLLAMGYYVYDEDTESYKRTVCYRETLVRNFKKRRDTHRTAVSHNASSDSADVMTNLNQYDDDLESSSCEGGDSLLHKPDPTRRKPAASTSSTDAPRHGFGARIWIIAFTLMALWHLLPTVPSFHMIGSAVTHPGDLSTTKAPSVKSPSSVAGPGLDHVELSPELKEAAERWLMDRIKEQREADQRRCERPIADRMADFALEPLGATVVQSRSSETHHSQSTCRTLFGFSLWCRSQSPRVAIQGFPELLPGRCWPFQGHQGTLVVALSHPVRMSHVTLDHLPSYSSPSGRIDSAPKDFEIYGMEDKDDDGTLLGKFTYDQDGDPTQTFELPKPSEVHRYVSLRVLSNWGHAEYTCVYRFRVHGTMDVT